jgi:PadR family transcriptional regulator, regulatory protein PadR
MKGPAGGAPRERGDLLHGTLGLLILKTLDALGPLHGYGIARRLEQTSGHQLLLNHGSVYPALVRLEQLGWIGSKWSVSKNNRRARYYSITASGRRRLKSETEQWARTSGIVARVLRLAGGPGDPGHHR